MRNPSRLLFLAMMGAPAALWARGQQPANDIPSVAEVAGKRVFLRLLPSAADGFYAVWNSTGASGNTVVGQLFGFDGSARWQAPGVELAKGLPDGGLWDACDDAQGGTYVVAEEQSRLMLHHFGRDSKLRWDQEVLPAESAGRLNTVIAVPDREGGVYLTWAQGDEQSSIVWVQRWDAGGQKRWPGLGVRPAVSDARQTNPNLIADGQGGVIAAWKSLSEAVSKVRVQRLSGAGQRMWAPNGVVVQTPAGDLHQRVLMAAPGKGGVVIAWTEGAEGKSRLFFQHVGPDGKRSWSVSGVTQQPPTSEQWNPVILGDGNSSVWIGWEEVKDGGDSKVRVVRRDPPDGKVWPPAEISLANAPGSQARMVIDLDGDGGLVAAWVDNRVDVGIYLQNVDPQGRLRLGPGLTIAPNAVRPQRPNVLVLPGHRVAVVWTEETSSGKWSIKERVVNLNSAPQ